jgi:hypothetical protein
MISAVIDSIPHCHLSSGFKDNVLQEWKLYQDDTLAEDLFISAKGHRDDGTTCVNYKRIDEYWSSVLESTNSCGSSLGVLVKAALSLLHDKLT